MTEHNPSRRHRLRRQLPRLSPALNGIYRLSAVIWMISAASLGGYAYGSVLLADAGPLRLVVPALASLVFLAMLLRLLAPGRPAWSRWALPLLGGLSVCTTTLTAFGVEEAGITAVRLAVIGLTFVPGLIAYAHWVGESLVQPR